MKRQTFLNEILILASKEKNKKNIDKIDISMLKISLERNQNYNIAKLV